MDSHISCLSDELLLHCCDFMDAESLLSFALTHRRVAELSLSILWRSLNSLDPILNLLPNTYAEDATSTCTISDREVGLRAFEKYLSYVRSIRWEEDLAEFGPNEVSGLLGQLVTHWSDPHSIFAGINRFIVVCPSVLSLRIITAHIPFSLTTFDISLGYHIPFAECMTTLAAISKLKWLRCLKLAVFTAFFTPGQMLDAGLSLVDLVKQLRRLRIVALPLDIFSPVSSELVKALSTLGSLREVSLSVWTLQPSVRWGPASVAEEGFTSLHSILLAAVCVEDYTHTLSGFAHAKLRTLTLEANEVGGAKMLYKAMSAVASFSATLSNLDITLRDGRCPVTFAQHEPLLACRNLRRVALDHLYPLALTDDDIEHMLACWPRLSYLSLNPRPYYMDTFQGQLPSLVSLAIAARVPFLRHFGVYIDPSIHVAVDNGPYWQTLSSLDLGRSGHGQSFENQLNADDLIEMVDSLFPHAELVAENCSVWVRSVHETLANVRRDNTI